MSDKLEPRKLIRALKVAVKYKAWYHNCNPDVGWGPSGTSVVYDLLKDAEIELEAGEIRLLEDVANKELR